ncbi:MAG TPA: MBL fold metallo-hydrolase [Spirochaetota bacterium]|nr:MBL fold metallo-hydrolase [Spirochaetota bacterium]
MIKRVTSEIYIIGDGDTHPQDAAIYLIISGGEGALIDTGTGKGQKKVTEGIKKAGIGLTDIRYIFLTHCHYDHTGGSEELKKITGAEVIAHELDARYLKSADPEVTAASWYGAKQPATTVDTEIKGDRGSFMLGTLEISVIHTPGHTPGSMVLTVISDGKTVLFGQDVHGPLHPSFKSDRIKYLDSLKLLLSLDADILCEGHYGVITGQNKVREFIRSFIN